VTELHRLLLQNCNSFLFYISYLSLARKCVCGAIFVCVSGFDFVKSGKILRMDVSSSWKIICSTTAQLNNKRGTDILIAENFFYSVPFHFGW